MSVITIGAKVVGQRSPLFTDYRLPLPPELTDAGRVTLRDLITRIVHQEVGAFRQRQEERKLAQVLTPSDIQQAAERGKIDLGERDDAQEVDYEMAVSTALQAFEDGLYYVFIDDVQQESLDQTVFLNDNSRVLFVRLVALAGG